MKTFLMMMGTKLAAFMGLKTIGAFLLAKKALLLGKVALMLSGMMLYNKFIISKKGASVSTAGHSDWKDFSYGTGHGGNVGGDHSGTGSNSWSAGYDRRIFDS